MRVLLTPGSLDAGSPLLQVPSGRPCSRLDAKSARAPFRRSSLVPGPLKSGRFHLGFFGRRHPCRRLSPDATSLPQAPLGRRFPASSPTRKTPSFCPDLPYTPCFLSEPPLGRRFTRLDNLFVPRAISGRRLSCPGRLSKGDHLPRGPSEGRLPCRDICSDAAVQDPLGRCLPALSPVRTPFFPVAGYILDALVPTPGFLRTKQLFPQSVKTPLSC